MIRLIVNADDLGSGMATDRAIFRCLEKGIVTSASLLANGPSWQSAAREMQRLGLPCGVHLNLSESCALSGPITGLTDAAGNFPGKSAARHFFNHHPDCVPDIARELSAQLQRVLDSGLEPDHVDAHQHIYLFEPVTEALCATLNQFDLVRLRLPHPAEPEAEDPGGELGRELALYRQLAPMFHRRCLQSGFIFPQGLWGMSLLNRLSPHNLLEVLDRLSPGNWELMVHPGDLDPHNPFSGPQRRDECRALCHPRIIGRIQERGISLINFGDLP